MPGEMFQHRYLRGVMFQASGNNPFFARLPQGARPTHNLAIIIFTFNDVAGGLLVDANGKMEGFGGNAMQFSSLAAVSFPRNS